MIADRYVLGEVVGEGGMGVVYSAMQRSLNRTVAIKVPRTELLADQSVRARFRTEAVAGARISHRNIVRVFEFGEDRGAPFLVMEHISGRRLGSIVAEAGALLVVDALDLVRQLVAGLAEAHAVGVVHGDVKCDNILVETQRDGRAHLRLVDFGLARFADEPCTWNRLGHVSGTPEYLAPELIRGERSTFASDVYAVGIILHELIAGVTPFGGGSGEEIMARHLENNHVGLATTHPGVPCTVDEILATALAKDPRDRYEDATALDSALRQVEPPRTVATEIHAKRHPPRLGATTVRRRLAAGTAPEPLRYSTQRRAIADAIAYANPDAIVVAYLELAGELIAASDHTSAIGELERAVALFAEDTALHAAPVWRIFLLLAALYDAHGDRVAACTASREAYAQAVRTSSDVGRDRACVLLARLTGSAV